mgnify:CR=1 FL=1
MRMVQKKNRLEKNLDLILSLLYNGVKTLKHLPSMMFKRILFQSPKRQTESKAFLKSMNAQYNFSYTCISKFL